MSPCLSSETLARSLYMKEHEHEQTLYNSLVLKIPKECIVIVLTEFRVKSGLQT